MKKIVTKLKIVREKNSKTQCCDKTPNCDKSQKNYKLSQNSKTQSCHKTQKLKSRPTDSNCDKTQTQIVTKTKIFNSDNITCNKL